MANTYKSRDELKLKFQKLSKPKQQDFWDWIDAYWHKYDIIVSIRDSNKQENIKLDGENGAISLFSNNHEGRCSINNGIDDFIILSNTRGEKNIKFNSASPESIPFDGGNIQTCKLTIHGEGNRSYIKISGEKQNSQFSIGQSNQNDCLKFTDTSNAITIHLDGANGGNIKTSKLSIIGNNIKLSGEKQNSQFSIGQKDTDDSIFLYDKEDNLKVKITTSESIPFDGGNIQTSKLSIHGEGNRSYIKLSGEKQGSEVSIGQKDKHDHIILTDSNNLATIELFGESGKIWAKGGITSDFVFDKNYQLPTTEKINQFIQKNKHLPDLPSAQEIKENGLSLTDFSMKLLQKIEELTLYVIDLQKQINELKATK